MTFFQAENDRIKTKNLSMKRTQHLSPMLLHTGGFKLEKQSAFCYLSPPTILNGILSLKTQNFPVKSNSENRFNFIQKNSEYHSLSVVSMALDFSDK